MPTKVKNRKFSLKALINVVIGAALLFVLYFQFLAEQKLEMLKSSFPDYSIEVLSMIVILMLLLVLLNWSIEALKWKWIVEPVVFVPYLRALQSTFMGNAVGIFTPNRVGEIVGRLFLIPSYHRKRGGIMTFYGSLATTIGSVFASSAGLLLIKRNIFISNESFLLLSLGLIFTIGYLIFPSWQGLFRKLGWIRKYLDYFSTLRLVNTRMALLQVFLATLRFTVFILQYVFVLKVLGLNISLIDAFAAVSLIYLLQTLVPVPVMIELGLRGNIALIIFAQFGEFMPSLIVLAAYLMWVFNMFLTSLIGYLLILRR